MKLLIVTLLSCLMLFSSVPETNAAGKGLCPTLSDIAGSIMEFRQSGYISKETLITAYSKTNSDEFRDILMGFINIAYSRPLKDNDLEKMLEIESFKQAVLEQCKNNQ